MVKKISQLVATIIIFVCVGFYLSQMGRATHEVVIDESGFNPEVLTVVKGDKITFKTNLDNPFWPASDPHPIHDVYSTFDAKKPVDSSSTWEFRPLKVGEWNYHDHLFTAFRGKLIVLSKKDFEISQRVSTRDEITKMIEKDGPSETYQKLQKIYDGASGNAHSTFHILGEVLYSKLGISGISNCNDFAGFGCYHGLFIKAVSEKGIDEAYSIDKECVKIFGPLGLGCPHGIGHGLVEYFGYAKLQDALSICSKLTWQGSLFGCSAGVFMENNFRTVYKDGESTITIREPHGSLYEPCRSLDVKFRQSCYFEQASWWRVALHSDYKKIGELCTGLKGLEKDACLLGLGNSVSESSLYNKSLSIEACGQMPDDYSKVMCRTGSAWAFFANPDKRSLSESLCLGLGNNEKTCLEKRILVGQQ